MAWKVYLEHDPDVESPNDWGVWRLHSFSNRHVSYTEPRTFISHVTPGHHDIIPANIGIQRKLTVGSAFWLSYFEHGDCVWSLKGEGPSCPWDSVSIAGFLDCESTRDLPKGHDKREEWARAFVEEYTEWANGHTYQFRIEDEQGEQVDGCSGYIGMDYMIREIARRTKGHDILWDGSLACLAPASLLAVA